MAKITIHYTHLGTRGCVMEIQQCVKPLHHRALRGGEAWDVHVSNRISGLTDIGPAAAGATDGDRSGGAAQVPIAQGSATHTAPHGHLQDMLHMPSDELVRNSTAKPADGSAGATPAQ
jgi:hypothetical protein